MSDKLDWRDMFGRYAEHVGEEEGVYFLKPEMWTAAERAGIREVLDFPADFFPLFAGPDE